MSYKITLKSIAEKLFEHIFSNDAYQKTKLVKNALPFIEMRRRNFENGPAMSKAIENFLIHKDMNKFKEETANCETFVINENDTHRKFDSFNFTLNKVNYYFERDASFNIHIKVKPKENSIDKKYLDNVSENIEDAKNVLKEMAQVIPFYDIADTQYEWSSSSYMTVIFSASSYSPALTVFTDRFISLVDNFKEVFTEEEISFLNKTEYHNTEKAQRNLNPMFNRWVKFLKKGKYTSENPYEFNDMDNEAFVEENEKYILMSQQSQNTLFAYIKEKETGRIKVFNYASKGEFTEHDEKTFKEAKNYLALFKKINNHYSCEHYNFDLESHLYPRFFEYYFNNFETKNNLVYDSNYGFNLKSHYIKTLEEDFDLFNSSSMFDN